MKRAAGILMHITSLPNKYGIGTLGKEAYRFADFLKESGQSYWQILPVTPTNYGDSPYQSSSVYAFNPYMIDLDMLKDLGLLKKSDYDKEFWGSNELDTDYANLFIVKNKVLKKAYQKHEILDKEFSRFKRQNSGWLDGYALYESIKESFGFIAWNEWPTEYRLRDEKTINRFKRTHKSEIDEKKFIQFLFYFQWKNLKEYVNSLGIKLIGDMPIYAAYDSADVWFNPGMFQLDAELKPLKVAGCPPDGFNADGQLWGNPLYRWDLIKKDGYSWWVDRISKALDIVDIVRIDHFRGFAGYFTIPYGDTTAKNGTWEIGPGYDLFKTVKERIPNAEIIAENLGFLDDSVQELLDDCGYPGMHVVQFDFGDGYDYHPLKDGLDSNNILYTGTHDNQTIRSWYNSSSEYLKGCIREYYGFENECDCFNRIIEKTMETNVDTVIVPMQDYLGLFDWEGRMNTPSTLGINWRWRMRKGANSTDLSKYIKRITKSTKRL